MKSGDCEDVSQSFLNTGRWGRETCEEGPARFPPPDRGDVRLGGSIHRSEACECWPAARQEFPLQNCVTGQLRTGSVMHPPCRKLRANVATPLASKDCVFPTTQVPCASAAEIVVRCTTLAIGSITSAPVGNTPGRDQPAREARVPVCYDRPRPTGLRDVPTPRRERD